MYSWEWGCIKTIKCSKLSSGLVPYRLTLTRGVSYDSLNTVTAAGWSWTEAAVALFSTADLGRFTPSAINKVIVNKLGTNLDEDIQNFLSLVDNEKDRFQN